MCLIWGVFGVGDVRYGLGARFFAARDIITVRYSEIACDIEPKDV